MPAGAVVFWDVGHSEQGEEPCPAAGGECGERRRRIRVWVRYGHYADGYPET